MAEDQEALPSETPESKTEESSEKKRSVLQEVSDGKRKLLHSHSSRSYVQFLK